MTFGHHRTTRGVLFLAAGLTLALISAASSNTWVVDGSGGGDFLRIQDGVDAAEAGDTVLVLSGIYNEWVRIFDKDGIHLIGGGAVEDVVISADTMAVDVRNTDPPARIEGVTLTGAIWYGALHDAGRGGSCWMHIPG
jgi:pectin methylesterase-like acyl-CoA thioesterase